MPSSGNLLVRLLAPYLFVLVAVAAGLYVFSDRVIQDLYLDTLSDTVLRQARLAAELLPWGSRGDEMDRHCAAVRGETGARVTVIAADGTVLGDSDVSSAGLDNHRDRPEIRAAFQRGEGHGMRASASVHRSLLYRAWRQTRADGSNETRVIRLAVAMETIELARNRIRLAIWGGVVLAALAALWPTLVLTRRLSRRVSRLAEFSQAVAEAREPPVLAPEGKGEIGRLEHNVSAMAASLSGQLSAAREGQAKLEAVLRSMVEGVVVIDRNGTVNLSNRCAEQLFGLDTSETMAGTPLIAISRDPDLHALVREVMRPGCEPPLVREMTLEGASLQMTATPIDEAQSEPQLFILVFHDITKLKLLEATRRDFVANVSHELRTPLTAIRGFAETLRAGAINDPELAGKFLEVIERHSERLSRLTEELLTLSDLELGRAELQRTAMALSAAVDSATEVIREKATRKRLEIRRDLPADLPPLYADADSIEQLLVNLLDNAVKYTAEGGCVTVRARALRNHRPHAQSGDAASASASYVEVSVEDTGIGIPSQDLPRLTERFYRVDKARSRELGGTGLGLAIVKHVVQAHEGTLRIESDVGKGTRVSVVLPAIETEAVLGSRPNTSDARR